MNKIAVVLMAILFSMTAQAQIENSTYEARHQELLASIIYDTCGVAFGRITQISSAVSEDHVDQGVVDYHYSTKFELMVKYDQGVIDRYSVSTESSKFSAYDHKAKDWGLFSVSAATCTLID